MQNHAKGENIKKLNIDKGNKNSEREEVTTTDGKTLLSGRGLCSLL